MPLNSADSFPADWREVSIYGQPRPDPLFAIAYRLKWPNAKSGYDLATFSGREKRLTGGKKGINAEARGGGGSQRGKAGRDTNFTKEARMGGQG